MKLNEFNKKLQNTLDHFKNQLVEMRTGAANPGLIENIKVAAYDGSGEMTIKELATISIVDATLLSLEPWDKSIIAKIEKAIRSAGKNLNPTVEGNIIRVPVPQLTEETRMEYVKGAKQKLEEAKIAVRNIRQDAIKSIEEQEDQGVISEDEMNRDKKAIDESVKQTNETLEELFKIKEKELLEV